MIVVAILGVLVVVLGESYSRWSRRFAVESSVKTLNAYLMDARSRAMTRYRVHFLTVGASRYGIFEDTSPAPDGDGALDGATDNVVHSESVAPFTLSLVLASGATTLSFNRDGTVSDTGYLRVVSNAISVEYDCIQIMPTRLRTGIFDGTTCRAK